MFIQHSEALWDQRLVCVTCEGRCLTFQCILAWLLWCKTPPQAGVERHTTPENIRRFFDPNTYRQVFSPPCSTWVKSSKGVGCDKPTSCQKRPPPSEASSSAAPAAKAKVMNKNDLMEKFKLAAKLNGIEWDDIAVARLFLVQSFWLVVFHVPTFFVQHPIF